MLITRTFTSKSLPDWILKLKYVKITTILLLLVFWNEDKFVLLWKNTRKAMWMKGLATLRKKKLWEIFKTLLFNIPLELSPWSWRNNYYHQKITRTVALEIQNHERMGVDEMAQRLKALVLWDPGWRSRTHPRDHSQCNSSSGVWGTPLASRATACMWYKQAKHPYTQSNKIIFFKKEQKTENKGGRKEKRKASNNFDF